MNSRPARSSSYDNDNDAIHPKTSIIGNCISGSAMMAGCSFFSPQSRRNNNTRKMNVVEPKKEETDALLAQTLNQLSMEERNQAFHDLHGVADFPEETSDFVTSVLDELKIELNLIPNSEKQAFRLAESMSTLYVHDSVFQLGFLRAELYKAKPAAQRMVKYFEHKLQLFGREKLTRSIRLDDLQPIDLEYLQTGYFQLFPERDQTGRAILCNKVAMVDEVPMDIRCRLTWYVYNVVAEDEQVQRKGAIIVVDAIGLKRFFSKNPSRDPRMIKLTQCFPIRLSAIHVCYDNPVIHPFIKIAVFVLDQNQQCRIRFHYGSRMECYYALMTFGIPKQVFAIDHDDRKQRLTNVDQFLKQRKAKEESVFATHTVPNHHSGQEQKVGVAIVPREMDILMGRGKGKIQLDNPGNQRYQKILREHYDTYERASEKILVIELVLQKIKTYHGRFLRNDNTTGWTEIDDSQARKKIGHAFRNLRVPGAILSDTNICTEVDHNDRIGLISTKYIDKIIEASSRSTSSLKRVMEDEIVALRTEVDRMIETSSSASIPTSLPKRGMEEEVLALRDDCGITSMSQRAKKFRF